MRNLNIVIIKYKLDNSQNTYARKLSGLNSRKTKKKQLSTGNIILEIEEILVLLLSTNSSCGRIPSFLLLGQVFLTA